MPSSFPENHRRLPCVLVKNSHSGPIINITAEESSHLQALPSLPLSWELSAGRQPTKGQCSANSHLHMKSTRKSHWKSGRGQSPISTWSSQENPTGRVGDATDHLRSGLRTSPCDGHLLCPSRYVLYSAIYPSQFVAIERPFIIWNYSANHYNFVRKLENEKMGSNTKKSQASTHSSKGEREESPIPPSSSWARTSKRQGHLLQNPGCRRV